METLDKVLITVQRKDGRQVLVTVHHWKGTIFPIFGGPPLDERWLSYASLAALDEKLRETTDNGDGPFKGYYLSGAYADVLDLLGLSGSGEHMVTRNVDASEPMTEEEREAMEYIAKDPPRPKKLPKMLADGLALIRGSDGSDDFIDFSDRLARLGVRYNYETGWPSSEVAGHADEPTLT